MTKYLKVICAQRPTVQNYFTLVFFRGEQVKPLVSCIRWVWLCVLEVLFGQELLEHLVTTASNSGCPEDSDPERKYGEPNHLNAHIPSGLFTNMFRNQLLQLLYYKFYRQYLFLVPVAHPVEDVEAGTVDVTRVRFRLRKELLHLVIPFRRVYVVTAIVLNLLSDLLVYLITTSVFYTVATGVVLEFFRRILKL